jgi:hypothetical protein
MKHTVGEAAHLRMATFAGVASKGVRQGDYLPQRFEDATTRCVAAHRAPNPILMAVGSQPARFAAGADDGLRSGT